MELVRKIDKLYLMTVTSIEASHIDRSHAAISFYDFHTEKLYSESDRTQQSRVSYSKKKDTSFKQENV